VGSIFALNIFENSLLKSTKLRFILLLNCNLHI